MVACDAGPLIYLSQVGQFNLLRELFGAVAIAPAVKVETVDRATGYPSAGAVSDALAAGWMKVVAANDGAGSPRSRRNWTSASPRRW